MSFHQVPYMRTIQKGAIKQMMVSNRATATPTYGSVMRGLDPPRMRMAVLIGSTTHILKVLSVQTVDCLDPCSYAGKVIM